MRKEDLFPDLAPLDPAARLRNASNRIRALRSQVGHEGLTPSATRTLIDELSAALDAAAAALEERRSS